jgi:ribosomal-protein-alanine N-acetyltransferase
LNTDGDSIGESLISVALRPAHPGRAAEIAALYRANREFLARFVPPGDDSFYRTDGQRRALEKAERERAADAGYRFVIEVDTAAAGVLSVSRITRGPFQNAGLGYWVAESLNGRGVATRAVGLICEWGFGEAGFHRLEAATLIDNIGSQIVLRRNRFTLIGLCPRYLNLGGGWSDHLLFARTVED